LKLIEKIILSTMYVCQINGNEPVEIIKKKTMLLDDQINTKITELIEKNLV